MSGGSPVGYGGAAKLPAEETSAGARPSRTCRRRTQRKAYLAALRTRLSDSLASSCSELARRLALAAPVVGARLEGSPAIGIQIMRRNAALHAFDTTAAVIASASATQLNRIQRGPRRSRAAAGADAAAGLAATDMPDAPSDPLPVHLDNDDLAEYEAEFCPSGANVDQGDQSAHTETESEAEGWHSCEDDVQEEHAETSEADLDSSLAEATPMMHAITVVGSRCSRYGVSTR